MLQFYLKDSKRLQVTTVAGKLFHKIMVEGENESWYVTGPAKAGHVDTNYTLSLLTLYLSNEREYVHSVTCIIMPNKFVLSAEIVIAIECWDKMLWVLKNLKSRQKSCAHMPCFRRPGHIYVYSSRQCVNLNWWPQVCFVWNSRS